MKRFAFVERIIAIFVLMIVLFLILADAACLSDEKALTSGAILVPSADFSAKVYSYPGNQCDCCPVFWNGGRAIVQADMSAVNVDDMAIVILLDRERMVMECLTITPCIKLGRWLISWPGALRVDGDLLIYSNGFVYRFIRL